MEKAELYKLVQDKLSEKEIYLSDDDMSNLYTSTISSINEILDKGDTLDISAIGSLWRRKSVTSSLSFFKPTPTESSLEEK